MKTLCTIALTFIFLNCNNNYIDDKKMINDFVTEIILNKNYTSYELLKFIKSDNLDVENKKEIMFSIIDENIKFIRKKNQKKNSEYRIISHKEIKKEKIILNFQFDDYTKVYHLVSKREVLTSFIIDNNKIISFSYNIIKNKNSYKTPLLL
jgi:translation elongation factor EF-Ts